MNPDMIRVILIGQDPYIRPGQAMGLSFSVPNSTPIPPSLQNIFKELASDLGGEERKNPDLTDWFEQGVFLINQTLTVREGKSNSHASWWRPFMRDFWCEFWKRLDHSVVIWCWGKDAEIALRDLPVDHKHKILRAPHPSPLSAYRGFFGSKPFSQTNEFLKTPILWHQNQKIKEYSEVFLAVVGTRTFDDMNLFRETMKEFFPIKKIISGGATGADQLAKEWAHKQEIAYEEYLPDWNRYGKRAGPLRNEQIVNSANSLLAFWDGKSRGTKSSIDLANKKGIPVRIIYY